MIIFLSDLIVELEILRDQSYFIPLLSIPCKTSDVHEISSPWSLKFILGSQKDSGFFMSMFLILLFMFISWLNLAQRLLELA